MAREKEFFEYAKRADVSVSVRRSRSVSNTGWVVQLAEPLGWYSTLATSRGGTREFSTLDAVERLMKFHGIRGFSVVIREFGDDE